LKEPTTIALALHVTHSLDLRKVSLCCPILAAKSNRPLELIDRFLNINPDDREAFRLRQVIVARRLRYLIGE
jgi:hypothetical protein